MTILPIIQEHRLDLAGVFVIGMGWLMSYRRVRWPSKADLYRRIGAAVVRAAALVDLECQARADGADAWTAAYKARKVA